jgi:hypothetical protein
MKIKKYKSGNVYYYYCESDKLEHGLLQYYYTNNNYSCIIHFYRGRKKGFSLIKNSFYGN